MIDIQPIDLNNKTVFVLGAGASAPYGFPIATELKTQITTILSDINVLNNITNNKFDQVVAKDFITALKYTDHPTIDIFLEKKKSFREIGACAIAYTLLPKENEDFLLMQKDWYHHIYNVLNFEKDNPNIENITFVTLNYDRSFEHYLAIKLKANCDDDIMKDALKKFNNLNIIHAHGSLGPYPKVSYGAKVTDDNVLNIAAQGIRIVSEQLEDTDNFRAAQNAINSAFNIVFLGFGYDPTTLELLIKDTDLSNKKIYGTTYNLDNNRKSFVHNFFKKNADSGNLLITDIGINAVQFLSSYLPITP